ncbi:hypothetical protein BE21_29790 [Sorangium cellulosum]|uniref:Uncharacterized protein n=1 Tax=Sorangium cellulosum TaxID=56 RepID=A0A150TRM0_SORCE|nr:hypothetical protein BE21_29790 [Sorangium cellulosum]
MLLSDAAGALAIESSAAVSTAREGPPMVVTLVCEECGQAIASEAALYSTAGELICSSCEQAAVAVELEQRGQTSVRRGRIVLGVAIAVVVMVPTVMFFAGLGPKMGEVMMVLGVGCLLGAANAIRIFRRPVISRHITFPAAHIAALAAIGGVVGGAGYGVRWLAEKYPSDSDRLAEQDADRREAGTVVDTRTDASNPHRAVGWRALEEQKQAVETDPSSFLIASEFYQTAAGVVDETNSMDALTVVNNSRFALWKIQGAVDWMDGDRKVASMVFTVKERMLMPKELRKVTTDAGTLETARVMMVDNKPQANFTRAVVRFTQAVVKE